MGVENLSELPPREIKDIDIIQGGMGIGVSWYKLAGAVAAEGAMGVISGTVIGPVLARRLQEGDPNGLMREALKAFPDQEISGRIIERYYSEEGHKDNSPYKSVPMFNIDSSGYALELNMVGAFVEVWLAKHIASEKSKNPGPIGMNLLTKLQAPTLSALYGAMLAGVDCIIMGAGIPHDIPEQLNNLVLGKEARLRFDVTGSKQNHYITFNPENYPNLLNKVYHEKLKRPTFLAIVASNTLAKRLSNKDCPPNGFIIEGPTAGGHNAPPRDKVNYGDRDIVDIDEIAELERPFWLAGGYDHPQKVEEAKKKGANGVQVGTAFAICEDSGISPQLKKKIIEEIMNDGIEVVTDMLASPTGFPFKVVQLSGTISESDVLKNRQKVCDLGFLREAYVSGISEDGKEIINYRCASEPEKDYIKKGGNLEDTVGRTCLCNALMATIELGQTHHGKKEDPIVTAGDTLNDITRRLVSIYGKDISAKDVVMYLRGN